MCMYISRGKVLGGWTLPSRETPQLITTPPLAGSQAVWPCAQSHRQQHRQHRHPLHLYTSRFTLGTPHFCTLHSSNYTPHSALYTPRATDYTLHSTLYTVRFAFRPLHLTLHFSHFTLDAPHSTLYTPRSRLWSLHFALYTPNTTLDTSHLTLQTLHFTVHTLHYHTLHPDNFTLFTLYTVWNRGLASFSCCARTPTSRSQLWFCTAVQSCASKDPLRCGRWTFAFFPITGHQVD